MPRDEEKKPGVYQVIELSDPDTAELSLMNNTPGNPDEYPVADGRPYVIKKLGGFVAALFKRVTHPNDNPPPPESPPTNGQ